MEPPSCEDKVVFDANALIESALDLGKIKKVEIRSYIAQGLNEFLDCCRQKGIEVGCFGLVSEEAYRRIIPAVNRLAGRKKVGSRYRRSKLAERGVKNLDRLTSEISEFDSRWTGEEVEKARQFFIDNRVDVQKALNLQHSKSDIPDDNDLKIFVCSHNLDCDVGYILSNDAHFLAYRDIIHASEYEVRVLDTWDCQQNMIAWNWKW